MIWLEQSSLFVSFVDIYEVLAYAQGVLRQLIPVHTVKTRLSVPNATTHSSQATEVLENYVFTVRLGKRILSSDW